MALSSQGTRVKIATAALAGKTITAITKANGAVVTSSTHGLAVGTVVVITGVVGMTELNDRAFVITAQDTNTFTLGGVDSTNYTTYASGGTATPQTMTEVSKVTAWNRAGTPAAEIDASHLASTAVERLSGLADRGSVTMPVIISHTDPGQKAVRDKVGGDPVAMQVTLRDGKSGAVMVSWNNFSDSLAVGAAHTGEFSGYVASDYAWYA